MIGYMMVGTNDLPRAKAFYDPLMAHMGLSPCFADAQVVSWGDAEDDTVPRLFACTPFDGAPATVGNGTMVAFRLPRAADVDALYDLALSGGGVSEGAPGFRPEAYGDRFYVAYARDPDGNKLAFSCYDGKANP